MGEGMNITCCVVGVRKLILKHSQLCNVSDIIQGRNITELHSQAGSK